MKQPEVFKKIGGIIKELQEQYDYLQATAAHLNDLELELFVANTHFLMDHAEVLRKLNLLNQHQQPELPLFDEKNTTTPAPEKEINEEPKYFEPVVQQKAAGYAPFNTEELKPLTTEPIQVEPASPVNEPTPHIDLGSNSHTDDYSYQREEPDTIRHELILSEADTWDDETIEPADEPGEEALQTREPEIIPATTKPEEQITEAEKPIPTNPEPVIDNEPKTKAAPETADVEKPLSLNQRMAAQLKEKQSNTGQRVEAPIADIKAVINLNDKMLFIKELFNGYPLSYSEAIEIVNRFKSFDEADRFLKTNYVIKNNWEAKKAISDKFYGILKRRYA